MKKLINYFTLAAITGGLFSFPAVNDAFAAPLVLVDQSHEQRFVIEKEDPLHLSALAVGEFGAGRFVVFGDDAIFQNKFLDEQNRLLAKNLARWFK